MPRIQANRDSIDDRFSVLGFTVRTESPLFEVGVATDPQLFKAENRAQRTRRNFHSSRAVGALHTRRGEAVYLLPPDVLANFVGQTRLYFGLATYREGSGGIPDHVQSPGEGNLYVNLAGLTERGLRRIAARPASPVAYGATPGTDPSLDWGGDAQAAAAGAQLASTNGAASGVTSGAVNGAPTARRQAATRSNGSRSPAAAEPPVAAAPYDDGFGDFPAAPIPAAPPAAATQALQARRARALSGDDDGNGIEGPIPDGDLPIAAAQGLRTYAQPFDVPAPEYPRASRYAPAAAVNYRSSAGLRSIERIVIHITDGGGNINGTIGWFQNPDQRDARGNPIHVSAHYVIGQDGEVVQMVRHNDVAWHARSANATSIGIEHVANTRGLNPTPAQLCASAALVTWLCDQYSIAADRDHIVGHAEADTHTTHTGCPNAVWDWDAYMGMVGSRSCEPGAVAQALGRAGRHVVVSSLEIITPFYDPADPMSALTCQADAFSLAREEWFMGVPGTAFFPHAAICLLRMLAPDGSRTRGTGFYIGRNRILTCAHNLHGQSNVIVIPGRNGADTEPFGACTVDASSWRVAPGYSGDGDWNNDLAVIDNVPIEAPGGQWFGFLNATPSDHMPLVVCGYSKGSKAVPELTAAIDGDKQHLHGGYASGQSNLEVIEYPILTLKGASGSPVYHLGRSGGDALEARVCAVHVTGEPARAGQNRGCFITPDKIDWIEGRAASFALGARALGAARALSQSFSVHWDDTPYQPQSSTASCWAASAAMVVGWRDRVCIADSEIARVVPVIDAYRNGLPPSSRIALADAWGLLAEPPASYTVEAFRDMLVAHGPLYVGMNWDRQGGGHARVLVGMESGGAADGSDTTMFLYDPWPETAGRIRMPFTEFVALYEGRITGTGGVVDVQILHADGVTDRAPVSAAPFALALSAAQVRAPVRKAQRAAPLPRIAPGRASSALAAEAIEHAVPLIPQPDKRSCWAAAMAMLLSLRRNASQAPETLAAEVGSSLMTSYGFELLDAVRARYGFAAIEVPSNTSLYFSAAQWAQWLREYGPLWVVIVGMPHAVVVSGLRGDPADPASCQVHVLNPWDTRVAFDADPVVFSPRNGGCDEWLPFNDFAADFGNMAEPDYGNWRVLHLPAAAATAQSQGVRSGSRSGLTAPPARVRALALEDLLPPDEPIEPSRVPGTTMKRVRGSTGRVTWALDQLSGVKQPDPAAAMVPALLPVTIGLDQWPCVDGGPVPLPLSVRFDAGGGAVGNVRVSAGTPAAGLAYDVTVTATIEDDAPLLASGGTPMASLRLTIDHDFCGLPAGDASARMRLRLAGNGRYDLESTWQ